ncbi:hypothetical protein KGF56_001114 [Candida oxycetoniae]|uniref:Mitochondrial glycine transporter n=1 Tax=Candida oxycetoniae TaxID=497107 RepID=A0AAI9T0R2_9ASCO|nr:uncharacterized protein KGF56_001114 [Candida oxycetoniae]KAI3405895.2 hypothetical protein KGF56_001114 [Candida oxycetoniae]
MSSITTSSPTPHHDSKVISKPVVLLANKSPDAVTHLVSGGIAGLVSAVTLQPFDLLKTRLQQQQHTTKNEVRTTIYKELKKLTKIKDLWRGTLPSTLRTSIGAGLYFTILSKMRSNWAAYRLKYPRNGEVESSFKSSSSVLPKLTPMENLATGFFARAIVGYITMPITVIKTRFESNLYNYNSMYDGISGVYLENTKGGNGEMGKVPRHGGSLKNFFRGSTATLARDCPYAGLYVLSYELFKNDILPIFILRNFSQDHHLLNHHYASIINTTAAILAATTSTTITAPFDAIKTRLQLTNGNSMWKTFQTLMQEEGGFKNLFRGLSLRLSRKCVSAGISWCIYEELIKSKMLKDWFA